MTEATQDNRRLRGFAIAALSGLGIAMLALGVSDKLDGADHIDSSNAQADQPADIADLYAFRADNGNLVLAMTLSGVQSAPDLLLGESLFDPRVLYEFKLDDLTDGDNEANLVVQAFVVGNPRNQQMRIVGPVSPEMGGNNARIVEGPQLKVKVSTDGEAKVASRDGVKAFAGVREDPFFFDFVQFNEVLFNGATSFRDPGVDTFAPLNVYALVVEIEPDRLGGIPVENLGVWATTSR